MPLQEHRRDPIAISVAVALGPVFTAAGYCMHLIYDSGAVFYFLFCALVIPFVTLLASRSRFLTWQLAVFSLMLSVIFDNLRVNAIDRREIVSVSFLFWAVGTLLSSPVPAFLLLRSVTPRHRYVFGALIVVLWVGVKRITH
jgi:hypothetical protein